jgi:hypothetical protein
MSIAGHVSLRMLPITATSGLRRSGRRWTLSQAGVWGIVMSQSTSQIGPQGKRSVSKSLKNLVGLG